MVESRCRALAGWVDRATAFARLALEAELRIESDPQAAAVADDFLAIYAFCGAAAGLPSAVVFQPSDLSDLDGAFERSREQRQRDLETSSAALGWLLAGLKELDSDLADAVAAVTCSD
jgi:hypothetical protein